MKQTMEEELQIKTIRQPNKLTDRLLDRRTDKLIDKSIGLKDRQRDERTNGWTYKQRD